MLLVHFAVVIIHAHIQLSVCMDIKLKKIIVTLGLNVLVDVALIKCVLSHSCVIKSANIIEIVLQQMDAAAMDIAHRK